RSGKRRQFWLKVARAQAEIRARMEIAAKADPKFWLRFGPGKEGGGQRGWGAAAKRPRKERKQADWHPEFFQLLGQIAKRLAPMPEARQAILDLLDQMPNR